MMIYVKAVSPVRVQRLPHVARFEVQLVESALDFSVFESFVADFEELHCPCWPLCSPAYPKMSMRRFQLWLGCGNVVAARTAAWPLARILLKTLPVPRSLRRWLVGLAGTKMSSAPRGPARSCLT